MSFAISEGKDTLVFMTKEDHGNAEKTEIVEESPGIILPSGEINWDCPCLGGLASSPCAETFRESFTCFYYSTEEAKGSDCLPQFVAFKDCMDANEDYFRRDKDEDEDADADVESAKDEESPENGDANKEVEPVVDSSNTAAVDVKE
eukprot:m.310055 g.310055  ORF g.310055 m.310055 type:complete len:147 (+) comp49372_c0_seq1:79-519(+)